MRKIKYVLAFIILGGLIWYLFIKPNDYIVRFHAKTSPGTLFKGVEDWSLINQKMDSFSYTINQKTPYTNINESLEINGMSLNLDWNFQSINDSITEVKIGAKENKNSIYNRLTAPFINTEFKKKLINTIQDYKNGIEFRLKKKFNVKFIGVDTIPEIVYAYVELKNVNMIDKAAKMIDENNEFMEFLNTNNLKDGELPFLIISNWGLAENSIDFRYCFPIKQKDSFPIHEKIKYDRMDSKIALKAIYNGNYATSDRGWFSIHEYAKRHNINIEYNPVEIFRNNPHDGGNELLWKAEIFMPIKE